MRIFLEEKNGVAISNDQIRNAVLESIKGLKLGKVLLIPPDFTRFYSNAGFITNAYYHALKDTCTVDILPALGTHVPMTDDELTEMFGDIPHDRFFEHKFREDVVDVGVVPGEFISQITEGIWTEDIRCQINKRVLDDYDLIVSIGQVVPHEVVGMANHAKNLFVGCGGSEFINKSHMVGAMYGMERIMGKDHTPPRRIFDYAFENFLKDKPILFALTVTTAPAGKIHTHGLYISYDRSGLEAAVSLAQKTNLNIVEEPFEKVVVYLDPSEFKSTWLGNKTVYRTRMAIKDGGELIVLAPAVKMFGEDKTNDAFIRKYGYMGRENVLEEMKHNDDFLNNMGAAAHLIHGSSDGRFSITYAVKNITKEEIESVHFKAADYDEMAKIYNPETLKLGYNTVNGEKIYYIPNPALGLWVSKDKLN
ncbi:MAG: DUF2088 domain-containing protein [Clostridia bacterium]|nr:DUF2088 domain-containing protein [Clostridia bacterium]